MPTLTQRLHAIEARLDPADPTRGNDGVAILGYGEVSSVLSVRDIPGRVFKRMSGFPSREAAATYAALVERYVAMLSDLGVRVAPTELVPLEPAPGRHVVYVAQPRLDAARFGHALLKRGVQEEVFALTERVLAAVRRVLDANGGRTDGREIAVDAQLSNWHWPPGEAPDRQPTLIDVSTPFMRMHGVLEIGVDLFLWAYPRPMRWWLRRSRAVERYIDDYFDFERVATDLIGNFVKERAPQAIPATVAFVNDWIARQPDGERLGRVDAAAVRAYYAKDAATLELSLRARRFSRFVTTKLLRRRYDFILPGHIDR